jgi:hypothetical protein
MPAGMSGGGRHTVSFWAEKAASGPALWSTNSGTLSVWPEAWRLRTRIARCGTGSQRLPAATIAGSAGFATRTSPVSGRTAPPKSAAAACALTFPSDVPGVAVKLAVVPSGE